MHINDVQRRPINRLAVGHGRNLSCPHVIDVGRAVPLTGGPGHPLGGDLQEPVTGLVVDTMAWEVLDP